MAENQNPISNIQIIQKAEEKTTKFFSNLLNFKIILLLLSITIVIELILGIRLLFTPITPAAKAQPITGGQFIVVPENSIFDRATNTAYYKTGENINLTIKLATNGHNTDGADIILKYDPNILDLSSPNAVLKGDLYTEYTPPKIDKNAGTIQLSGLNSVDFDGFNGLGEFATLNLKALKTGTTSLTIEYKQASTTESNIIESGSLKDVLTEVKNLKLVIDNASRDIKAEKNTCEGYSQSCLNEAGHKGLQICVGGTISKSTNQCGFDPYQTTFCGSCLVK